MEALLFGAEGDALMCGILGWFGQGVLDRAAQFDCALDLLAHRGPNGRGVFFAPGVLLGHRRLSILDLSSAGQQPMVDAATGATLVFNGEIYNHIELRIELEKLGHLFVGNSDTEVLLHALVEWGEDALQRLNGMWSFALWQPSAKKLFLARDRFGVKPLYYYKGQKGFAFASEPKALLSLFPECKQVSEKTLLDFLGNNLLYAHGESFYKGIHVLPPAHCASYDPEKSQLNVRRYWNYPEETNELLDADRALMEFDELFTDAVRIRLRSDVPVGVTLSGGLDSTAVLSAASSGFLKPITCFTSIFDQEGAGELSWARLASRASNANLIPVTAPKGNWLQTMRKIAWHMDGPGYSPAVYPLWCLMSRARSEGVPVLLEGQGADEALGGYPQYAVLELLSYLLGQSTTDPNITGFIRRVHALRSAFTLRWSLAWTARELSPRLLGWHRKRVGFESLLRHGVEIPRSSEIIRGPAEDLVRQRLLDDHSRNILPGLLHYGDAISMAHGVEARNPFLDYRLVEWMFRLPSVLRFNHQQTKWVLREYLRNHNQPDIGNRKDKKGYPTPVREWLVGDQGLEIERLLINPDSHLNNWCDPKKILKLIKQSREGVIAAEHHLYKLVSTQIWLNECIDGNGP